VLHEHATSALAGEREWEFKHVVIRDVAYGRLPKSRRVGLHVRYADWIDELPDGGEEFVEILAYHLEQACLVAREVGRSEVPPPVERAVEALSRAGEKAEHREGFREAHGLYSRALTLVSEDDPATALGLRLRRANTYAGLGELRLASDELQAVVDGTRELDLDSVRCEALVLFGNLGWKQGSAAQAETALTEAEELAWRIGNPRLAIRASFEAAWADNWFTGEVEGPTAKLRKSLELATAEGDVAVEIQGLLRLSMMLLNAARLDEGEETLRRCVDLAGGLGSVRDAARAEHMMGMIKYYRRDLNGAEEFLERAQAWLERTGDGHFLIQNLRALSLVALARGDLAQAESHLRQASPLASEHGGYHDMEIARLLVVTLLLLGRSDEAHAAGRAAIETPPGEDPVALATVRRIEGELAAADGDGEAMRNGYRDAVRLLEEMQTLLDLGETHIEFSVQLRAFGDRAAADIELARADEIFASIGAAEAREAVWEARPPAATSS